MGWVGCFKPQKTLQWRFRCTLKKRSFIPVSYDVEHVEGHLMKITEMFENMILLFINVYAPVLGAERVVFWG